MNYKKDIWYILSIILVIISTIVMAVAMGFMYFGNNLAIIWFFAATPIFAIGILTAQSVRRRYEDAEIENGQPLPIFWRIRYALHNLQVLLIEKGLWRLIFATITLIGLIVTTVCGANCGFSAYKRSDIKNSPQYIANEVAYEEYIALYSEAKNNGEEDNAKLYFEIANGYHSGNAKDRMAISEYTGDIKIYGQRAIISGIITLFFGSALTSYTIYKKKKKK